MRSGTCIDCGQAFEFDKIKGRLPDRCPEHQLAHQREVDRVKQAAYRLRHPDRARESARRSDAKRDPAKWSEQRKANNIRRLYGLTPEQHTQLIVDQQGLCAVCKRLPSGKGMAAKLHVDHSHITGQRRGMLCSKCNTLLGLADEDPAILRAAIAYLKEWST